MASFTLDDIRDAAEKQWGHTDIELGEGKTVRLVNALRLPKENRKELLKLQEDLGEDDANQEALLSDAILLVAEDPGLAQELLDAVGDDLAILVQIFKTYSGETELGEASASES